MSGMAAPAPVYPPGYFQENFGPRLLAIDCTLFGIAAITMMLRIYVRVFILKMFGLDGKSFDVSSKLWPAYPPSVQNHRYPEA